MFQRGESLVDSPLKKKHNGLCVLQRIEKINNEVACNLKSIIFKFC